MYHHSKIKIMLTALAALSMLTVAFILVAPADQFACADNNEVTYINDPTLNYTISDNTLTISACNYSKWYDVTESDRPIWESDDNWGTVNKVIIGTGVPIIYPYAFINNQTIESVVLPDNIRIPWNAFQSCSVLKEVNISSGCWIGAASFSLTAIENITIPSSVILTDSTYQFSECMSLKSIVIECNTIAAGMFSGCTALESVVLPDTLTTIGSDAFEDIVFHENGDLVEPTSDNLKGKTWHGNGDGELYTTCKVSFDLNGYGEAIEPQIVAWKSMATAPVDPSYEGYTFGGWFKEASCTTAWNFGTDTVTSDTTLYAKWSSPMCTVTFNTQGHGTAPASITVENNSTISEPAKPIADGYTFGGWFKESSCKNEWNFSTDKVTSDTTLYAKWTVQMCTVTFDTQGHGTAPASVKVEKNSTISEPAKPIADGYTFGGWFKESSCKNEWNFSTDKVTSDTTLYAKWTANTVNNDNSTYIWIAVIAVVAILAIAGFIILKRRT